MLCKSGIAAKLLAVDCILKGKRPKMELPCLYPVKNDLPRILSAIESMTKACMRIWGDITDFPNILKLRSQYGVPTRLTKLIQLPGIGKTTAKQLYDVFDVRSEKDLIKNIDMIREEATSGIKRSLTNYIKKSISKDDDRKNKNTKIPSKSKISKRKAIGKDEFGDN